MRGSAWSLAAALTAVATSAAAEVKVVPTVLSGAAKWTAPNNVILNAVVQLNDSCWSNPRFRTAPPRPSSRAATTALVEIVADHETGQMCAMLVSRLAVPQVNWRIGPNSTLKSVEFVGSAQPVTVSIRR